MSRAAGRGRRAAALSAVAAVALVLASCTSGSDERPLPTLRPTAPHAQDRSVSVDFADVVEPGTDWDALARDLDAVHANTVDLDAGRVEWTAFDWDAHPDAAAEPGTDHLAAAAHRVAVAGDGTQRQVNLIVDSLVPAWIAKDPSVAGVDAGGRRSVYTASASQLYDGPVGDRLVEYVAALGERYDPRQVTITELMLDGYTFGADDLALYRRMTGKADWPRAADGSLDRDAPALGAWRSQVLAHLLGRMRTALDAVRDGAGRQIRLGVEVRVDWDHPSRGDPADGDDYRVLLSAADQLVLWAYIGTDGRPASDVERLTAGLRAAGFDMARFTVSVGLWLGDADAHPPDVITPQVLADAVRGAATNGVVDVDVTPTSLMTPDHWRALAQVWAPAATTPPAATATTATSATQTATQPATQTRQAPAVLRARPAGPR